MSKRRLSESEAAAHEERAAAADRRTYAALILARDAHKRGDRVFVQRNKRTAWNHESIARKAAREARRARRALQKTA